MRRRRELSVLLVLRDQRVDHARVFAVDTRDAAVFFQLQQRRKQILISDHHCRIRHVHFERRDTGLEHLRNFRADALVPVVDGHMEAIVTRGFPVRLLMPQRQPVAERLALVGTRKVNDHRRTAADRAAGAGGKIVRRCGIADVEIKMRVRIDEARKQELARHVHDLCTLHA